MEPISLILAALVAGAAAGAQDAAGRAVRDAYDGLRSLLERKLAGRAAGAAVLREHERAPDVWEKPLREELSESGAGQDEAIVRVAQRVLAAADPGGARSGKYNVTISGGKGIVVGDHVNVTMTFDDSD